MNLIRNLPGPLLIFLGAVSLSFGGLIVKSFEGSTLWQILFWRSLFFSLTVLAFLLISYKKQTLKSFINSIATNINPTVDLESAKMALKLTIDIMEQITMAQN